MTTVICLDDYHAHDRNGRKVEKITALDERGQNFDLMYEQVKALREGKAVDKPIYNHVSGLLDPAERIEAPKILVIEGLHPFYDERVRDLLDLKIYLDISDEIKFAWKVQRDMVRELFFFFFGAFFGVFLSVSGRESERNREIARDGE